MIEVKILSRESSSIPQVAGKLKIMVRGDPITYLEMGDAVTDVGSYAGLAGKVRQ